MMKKYKKNCPICGKPQYYSHKISLDNAITSNTCCKSCSYLAIIGTIDFVDKNLGVAMEIDRNIKCRHSKNNPECKGKKCQFN